MADETTTEFNLETTLEALRTKYPDGDVSLVRTETDGYELTAFGKTTTCGHSPITYQDAVDFIGRFKPDVDETVEESEVQDETPSQLKPLQ